MFVLEWNDSFSSKVRQTEWRFKIKCQASTQISILLIQKVYLVRNVLQLIIVFKFFWVCIQNFTLVLLNISLNELISYFTHCLKFCEIITKWNARNYSHFFYYLIFDLFSPFFFCLRLWLIFLFGIHWFWIFFSLFGCFYLIFYFSLIHEFIKMILEMTPILDVKWVIIK